MPDQPSHHLRYRLGRRGLMLNLMGLTYVLIGVGVLIRPDVNVADAFELLIPKTIRGIAWIASGAVAAAFAWRTMAPGAPDRPTRWSDGDTIGWVALYLMPFIRIASYGISFLSWFVSQVTTRFGIDGGEWLSGGSATAWYVALLHTPFILIVLVCSGWRENYRPASTEGKR